VDLPARSFDLARPDLAPPLFQPVSSFAMRVHEEIHTDGQTDRCHFKKLPGRLASGNNADLHGVQ